MRSILVLILCFCCAAPAALGQYSRSEEFEEQPYRFEGLYVGGFGGLTDAQFDIDFETLEDASGSGQGVLFGGLVGYNARLNDWLVGIEGDIGASTASFDLDLGAGVFQPVEEQLVLGFNFRGGYVWGERLLAYGVLGVAGTRFEFDEIPGVDIDLTELSRFYAGLRLGGGVELMLTDTISLRGEIHRVFDSSRTEGELVTTFEITGFPQTTTEAFTADGSRTSVLVALNLFF